MTSLRPALICALGVAALCAPRSLRADAVPPPPDNCPAGQVGVTSHSGPRCVPQPPQDCPPGWRGVAGGHCQLALCELDQNCQGGRVCRPQQLCYEQRTRYPYGREEVPRPITEWVAVNVCGARPNCPPPGQCRPGKLCVPPAYMVAAPLPRRSDGTVDTRRSGCGAGCVGAPRWRPPGWGLTAVLLMVLAAARLRPGRR